eukprot:NODE_9322_length_1432_cov_5.265134.p1 GENE.NODE_9322_length_1432_cov_5.265134~~NODE_9322_length_1432_cov_5.265134.p1  ORF type:complete len:414 (-),score=103.20 NODE_9322_length_1432_cov_5.265134:149-1390(-)
MSGHMVPHVQHWRGIPSDGIAPCGSGGGGSGHSSSQMQGRERPLQWPERENDMEQNKEEEQEDEEAPAEELEPEIEVAENAGEQVEVAEENGGQEEEPDHLICPITHVLFRDPVVNMQGHTYEREALRQSLAVRLIDPLTNVPLPAPAGGPVFSNHAVSREVDEFLARNPEYIPPGWPDRTRPSTRAMDEDVWHEKVWSISLRRPVRDIAEHVARFMRAEMMRPRAMIMGQHIGNVPGSVVSVPMLILISLAAINASLLGTKLAWALVQLVVELVSGVSCSLGSASIAFGAFDSVVRRECITGLAAMRPLLGTRSCRARVEVLGRVHDFLNVLLFQWACLHGRVGAVQVGYSAARRLLAINGNAQNSQVSLHSTLAGLRFGFIAGLSYAMLLLKTRAAATLVARVLFSAGSGS